MKKKKTKLVWDDEVRRFVPRFGYGKAQADGEKNWLMEIKVSECAVDHAAKSGCWEIICTAQGWGVIISEYLKYSIGRYRRYSLFLSFK